MTKTSSGGHRLDANYTEEVVGFALESFLTLVSFPRPLFTIEPFSQSEERRLGADARLHARIRGFRPFYMQFKKPAAYTELSPSRMVKDRRTLGLEVEPHSLFFPLRKKAEHHSDFQHNVLFNLGIMLRQANMGDAAYVCPLFLDRSAYRHQLHWSGVRQWLRFWDDAPWRRGSVDVNLQSGVIRFDRTLLFAEHITIPPHALVTDAKHRYSFTEAGAQVCFHSPEAVPEGPELLTKFLTRISNGFLTDGPKLRPNDSIGYLRKLVEIADESYGVDRPFEDDPIGAWMAWGNHLKQVHDIDQFALVRWESEPEEI